MRVSYYDSHPTMAHSLPYASHYEFEDVASAVWRRTYSFNMDEYQFGLPDYVEELRTASHIDGECKLAMLYDYALFELGTLPVGSDERAIMVDVVCYIEHAVRRNEHKGDGRSHAPKYGTWENWRHGRKRGAYRCEFDRHEWEMVSKSISKCWKDQRGKGRNKRNHQWR